MNDNKLKALVSLLDDPDETVSREVEHILISYGVEVIPFLEKSKKDTSDPVILARIENLIHKIQFEKIKNELQFWYADHSEDLLKGLLIINRYQFPNMDESTVYYQIEELSRSVWIKMMYEMSPYEKVQIINHVLFQDFGLCGNTADYHSPQNSYINQVLKTKTGNPILLACIYILVAQKLEIPIYGINLPKHFVAAYMEEDGVQPVFYINAFSQGQTMRDTDIISFLTQLDLDTTSAEYTMPCTPVSILCRVLRNLIFSYDKLEVFNKKEDMEELLELLE